LDVEGLAAVEDRVECVGWDAAALERVVRVDAGGAALAARILVLTLAIGSGETNDYFDTYF
jgi:hypothetical protein